MAKTNQQGELIELADREGLDPSLCNEDILPTPIVERHWNKWHIASLWVGMAVCIPTYMLASQMILGGLSWKEALSMIVLGNIIVAIPMVFNGHAGTKYGIPFPVLGRSSFGWVGIQLPSILRALVACSWFGLQTWWGGFAIVAIVGVITGNSDLISQFPVQLCGFFTFWLINMFFVWRGTESIRVLESLAAPLLVLIGVGMLAWGIQGAGGLGKILETSYEYKKPTVELIEEEEGIRAYLNLVKDKDGVVRASSYRALVLAGESPSEEEEATLEGMNFTEISGPAFLGGATPESAAEEPSPVAADDDDSAVAAGSVGDDDSASEVSSDPVSAQASSSEIPQSADGLLFPSEHAGKTFAIQFKRANATDPEKPFTSSILSISSSKERMGEGSTSLATYLFWLTAMVAFWATLALNIPDITRFASSQKDQIAGQFLGLPTTMALYSFIGVAVTCAAVVIFDDILITEDAPWDPIRLIARLDGSPALMIFAQLSILLATLSTNIAANVISPANSFANLWPSKISFKMGGLITGLVGIVILPWKLENVLLGFLLTYGAILGPVVGILIADYFVIRKTTLDLTDLYRKGGRYLRVNPVAVVALLVGVVPVLLGLKIDALKILYDTGWFVGFGVSFVVYVAGMKLNAEKPTTDQ